MCKDRSASRSRRCCALTPSARIGSVLSRGRHHSLERQEPAALARVLTVGWLVDSASPAIHLVMPATGSPAVLRALAGLRLSIAEPNYPQRVTGVDGEAPHPQSSAPSALRRRRIRLVCGALLLPEFSRADCRPAGALYGLPGNSWQNSPAHSPSRRRDRAWTPAMAVSRRSAFARQRDTATLAGCASGPSAGLRTLR